MGQGGPNLPGFEPRPVDMRPTRRRGKATGDGAVLAFHLIGLGFSVLFFGALVSSNHRSAER
jgi:hypothetical protein